MKCIWCKQGSEASKSAEHILPESLGNRDFMLPAGWVCDHCNNYLALKVEKPFLESYYGQAIRFEAEIPNKKGRIPTGEAIHLQSMLRVEIMKGRRDGEMSIGATKGSDQSTWVQACTQNKNGTLILPVATEPPNDRVLSRFIAKVGLEVLASRCIDVEGCNEEIVNQVGLDELRQYVRYNASSSVWPVYVRRLYPPNMIFSEGEGTFEVLNEWTILVTAGQEYYAVIAFFGIEYTINLGGPELDGYVAWLERSNHRSPLYWSAQSACEPEARVSYFD